MEVEKADIPMNHAGNATRLDIPMISSLVRREIRDCAQEVQGLDNPESLVRACESGRARASF